ncbi:MAG: hypothetical protein A3G24_26225 [Betaproteobacteria bacterium RIFCSPLOWO2_12_FULL_62_13]|nr:MAG: hypothetical protein A3G24_26225 [Betaproteobacteria bacterium RIFCSPLOWO2_12_FULL_62_13]
MKMLIALCAAILACGPLPAQTYKWVDERGVTNYGETPPAGRPAQAVDTQPQGSIESSGVEQKKSEAEMRRREEAAAPPAPLPPRPPVAVAAPVRGMDFDTFVRLQTGMTEGELLLRAGPPDYATVENFRNDIVKLFYYHPTVANPFITVVTLRGGRIANIERNRKIF